MTFRSRIWCISSSTISSSRNSSGRCALLDHRDRTPSAANIDAYSMPMTLAPTTAMARGTCLSRMMSSLVRMISPSAITPAGGAGCVPTRSRCCPRRSSASIFPAHDQRMRVGERCLTSQRDHVVSSELLLDDVASRARARRPPWRGAAPSWADASGCAAGVPGCRPAMREKKSTASRRVLLGIVPVPRHTPPRHRCFSTMAAACRAWRPARPRVARGPAADAHEVVVVRRLHPGAPRRRRLPPRAGLRVPCQSSIPLRALMATSWHGGRPTMEALAGTEPEDPFQFTSADAAGPHELGGMLDHRDFEPLFENGLDLGEQLPCAGSWRSAAIRR